MAKGSFKRALAAGLVLAFTGALCTFLILNAKMRTEAQIALNSEQKLNDMVEDLLPLENGEQFDLECRLLTDPRVGQNMRILKATQNGAEAGTILLFSTARGYSNPLILIGGFDPENKIHKIEIALSNETPGLGDKVDRKHGTFLDQLSGKGLTDAKFDVKKFGGDFDYITGATVTSRAIVLASRDALEALEDLNFDSLRPCRSQEAR